MKKLFLTGLLVVVANNTYAVDPTDTDAFHRSDEAYKALVQVAEGCRVLADTGGFGGNPWASYCLGVMQTANVMWDRIGSDRVVCEASGNSTWRQVSAVVADRLDAAAEAQQVVNTGGLTALTHQQLTSYIPRAQDHGPQILVFKAWSDTQTCEK